jgi:DNA-binding transcriptional LysR family regulator
MIDRIRALLIVIEEGSVNRAAMRLYITQPALSRQMQALEHEIGGKLLERETSGVKPTDLGHSL